MSTPTDTLTTDVAEPAVVEFEIRGDGSVVWLNVDGITRARVCRIPAGAVHVTDNRPSAYSGHVDVILRRLDGLKDALEAWSFEPPHEVQFAYDQVLRAVTKLRDTLQ